MANKRITEMYIKQIIKLNQLGKSLRDISKTLGVNRKTVTEYIKSYEELGSPDISKLDDKSLQELLFPKLEAKEEEIDERHRLAISYIKSQEKQRKKTGFTITNMYEDYKSSVGEEIYSRAQFYRIVSELWDKEKGSMKIMHQYGAKLYIDYAGDKLRYNDRETGEEKKVEVLVCILPASGYIYAEAVISQEITPFLGSIKGALRYIGGVPQGLVTDNLKSAVTRVGRYESVINKQMQCMADHYGTTIDPTRSRAPKDKAMVEGAVKIVYNKVYYEIQDKAYRDLRALNEAILDQLKKLNEAKLTHCDHSRMDLYLEEKAYLSPLPVYEYSLKNFLRAKVQKMGYVLCSKIRNYYSVPYAYIGKKVELQFDDKTMEIYYNNERIAMHILNQQRGSYTTITSHLSSANQAVLEWNPEHFMERSEQFGAKVGEYIKGLIDQKPYPEQSYRQILGIFHLCKKYNATRVNRACEMALKYPKHSYKMIQQIIENGRDLEENQDQREEALVTIPEHDNLRKTGYYS